MPPPRQHPLSYALFALLLLLLSGTPASSADVAPEPALVAAQPETQAPASAKPGAAAQEQTPHEQTQQFIDQAPAVIVAVEARDVESSFESLALNKAYRLAASNLLALFGEQVRLHDQLGPLVNTFTDAELTAVLSALISVEAATQSRPTEDSTFFRVTLKTTLDTEHLRARLAPLATQPRRRAEIAKAYAAEGEFMRAADEREPHIELRLVDNQVTAARHALESNSASGLPLAAPASGGNAGAQAIVRQVSFKGMDITTLLAVTGLPDEQLSSNAAGNFVCLRFGETWAVFQDNALSCLRKRLQYNARHQSACSCFGEASTFVEFSPQTKHAEP